MPYEHAVLHLLASVGYPGLAALLFVAALGIGAPIPVTALLLVIGALSGTPGGPSALPLAAVAVLGLSGGHAVDYACGRLGNRLLSGLLARLLERLGGSRPLGESSHSSGARALLLFFSRFLLTPLASPVSALAGVTGMPVGRYLALEAPGTAIYVGGTLLVGHVFGQRAFTGGGLLAFWLIVAALTLLPLALTRVVRRPVSASPSAVVRAEEASVPRERGRHTISG